MIIIPENSPDYGKADEAKAAMAENTVVSACSNIFMRLRVAIKSHDSKFDPPPSYGSSSESPQVISLESPSLQTPKSKPVNYLSLERTNSSIKGIYTIVGIVSSCINTPKL
jgi:hypothetical protein